MSKIELKSYTALITKSLPLNKNVGKLLFENLLRAVPFKSTWEGRGECHFIFNFSVGCGLWA